MIERKSEMEGLAPAGPSYPEIEIAWAAGLFEGEGSFSAQKFPSGKVQLSARLAMTDFDVVRKFRDIIGFGSVYERKVRKNEKPVLVWSVTEAAKVRQVIALFLPYLGERRRARALHLLDVGQNIVPKGERTHCPKGHAYDETNTYLERYQRDGRWFGARRCRRCRAAEARVKYLRRKAALDRL